MAIPSVDTYLRNEVSKQISLLQENPYIVKENILKDFDDKVASSFVNTFCNTSKGSGKEIPVTFTFGNNKNPADAFIVIQFKGSSESDDDGSLGGVMSDHDVADGNLVQEVSYLTIEKLNGFYRAYFEVSQPISNLGDISTFSGNFQIDGNRIYIPYDDSMQDGLNNSTYNKSIITYSPQDIDVDNNKKVHKQTILTGYEFIENYTIDSVSNNQDTLRCLDAILKTILIYMRYNATEQTEYKVAQLKFMGSDLVAVNSPDSTVFGEQIFYRRAEVSYKVTYSIESSYGVFLKKLNVNGGIKYEDSNKE